MRSSDGADVAYGFTPLMDYGRDHEPQDGEKVSSVLRPD